MDAGCEQMWGLGATYDHVKLRSSPVLCGRTVGHNEDVAREDRQRLRFEQIIPAFLHMAHTRALHCRAEL